MSQKKKVFGDCQLCRASNVVLILSHILPRWAYRRVIQTSGGAHPIQVEDGIATRNGRQLSQYMLCAKCERRFAADEDYVSRLVYQVDGSVPLLAKLGAPTVVAEEGMALGFGSIDRRRLCYFGASVLWRAARARRVDRCVLGARYEEEFRHYLDGQTEFPMRAACVIRFHDTASVPGVDEIFASPATNRANGFHLHRFLFLGIEYAFFVGGQIPGAARRLCVERGSSGGIIRDCGDSLTEWIADVVRTAEVKGSLALKSP